MVDTWIEIGNKCLSHANTLLEGETTPTMETIRTVRELVETAIEIDRLNLQWAQQSRSGAAVFQGSPFSPQAKGN
jgi:hypothetical protein